MDETRRKSAAKANTERGKNGIIHAMNNRAKTALALALAIVGGIAADLRCDASVTVETSTQFNPRPAAYTVKTYTEGSDPFVPTTSNTAWAISSIMRSDGLSVT